MNTLYSCCIADPFVDVAKRLEQEADIKAVYWIGDRSSSERGSKDRESIEAVFSGIVYHEFKDAWKGVFPKDIAQKASETFIDIDFLRKYASQEFQAISLMDRVDYDRQSFNFMERERFFISLAKNWLACLELYHIELVITPVNPHRPFDYVLYLVCKYKGIPFLTYEHTMVAGRIFPMFNFSDFDAVEKVVDDYYRDFSSKDCTVEELPTDIRENYSKLQQDYLTARPPYMAKHDINDKNNKNKWFRLKRFLTSNKLFGKHSVFIEGKSHYIFKHANQSMADSRFTLWEWYKKRKAALKYNDKLHKYYNSLVTDVSLDVPYIIFFLHYQPEETTAPRGDIFTNQLLCIETLLKNTPSDVLIYVKEHPNQFMSHMQGHMKRIKEFYDDLIFNSRVKLVPFEIDSFSLIKNALAVSTITGTVGWEAAVRHKPVVIFGLVWYERMKGILKVTDDASAKGIYDFITNYEYDEHAIIAYLHAIAKISTRTYHYKGYKEASKIPHEEAVENMTNSLIPLIKNIIK